MDLTKVAAEMKCKFFDALLKKDVATAEFNAVQQEVNAELSRLQKLETESSAAPTVVDGVA